MSKGFVYILVNPSLKKNLLKIGRTARDPETRSEELSKGTGIPLPYYVAYSEQTINCETAETLIHKNLKYCRVNGSREFFVLPLKEAIKEVSNVCESIESTSDLLQLADGFQRQEQQEKAIPYWQQAADRGNAEAQFHLWQMHVEGWGGLEDFEVGLSYLKQAANQEYPKAQLELAEYYAEEIIGGEKYAERAVYWGKKAVENGAYKGATIIGNMLAVERPGVNKDEKDALRWFKLAAAHGDAYAKYQVGVSYEGGLGVARDIDEAIKWYTFAAEAGDVQAQKRLAIFQASDHVYTSPNNANQHGSK